MKIIAEFCQNHNGKFEILKRMISEAADAGATHGKIQSIFADDLSFREEFENGKVDASGQVQVIKRPFRAEHERLKGLELTYDQHSQFIEECRKAGIIPLTTAFNLQSVEHLKKLDWRSIKVASYDCGSMPLIRKLADCFDELIISTGASYDEEIEATATYLNARGKTFSLLHCVTIYPTPLEMIHLKRLNYLRKFTEDVGFSDHTLVARDGVKAALGALYCGATLIERHFSVLREDETRDGKVSVNSQQLREIVNFSNQSSKFHDSTILFKASRLSTMG